MQSIMGNDLNQPADPARCIRHMPSRPIRFDRTDHMKARHRWSLVRRLRHSTSQPLMLSLDSSAILSLLLKFSATRHVLQKKLHAFLQHDFYCKKILQTFLKHDLCCRNIL